MSRVNALLEGTRVAGVEIRVGVEAPKLGRMSRGRAVGGSGYGACQRSSTRRRRVPSLPPPAGGSPGQARSRLAANLVGWKVGSGHGCLASACSVLGVLAAAARAKPVVGPWSGRRIRSTVSSRVHSWAASSSSRARAASVARRRPRSSSCSSPSSRCSPAGGSARAGSAPAGPGCHYHAEGHEDDQVPLGKGLASAGRQRQGQRGRQRHRIPTGWCSTSSSRPRCPAAPRRGPARLRATGVRVDLPQVAEPPHV
jgi:hypothetical protein